MLEFVARHAYLFALLALYPLLWYACYKLTGWYEHKTVKGEHVVHYGEHEYDDFMRHTPVLYILYLTALVVLLETSLAEEGFGALSQTALAAKLAMGIAVYPLSHGVVPFDHWGVRLTFTLYICAPFSGMLPLWDKYPLALIVSPLLILVYLCCWAAALGVGKKKRQDA